MSRRRLPLLLLLLLPALGGGAPAAADPAPEAAERDWRILCAEGAEAAGEPCRISTEAEDGARLILSLTPGAPVLGVEGVALGLGLSVDGVATGISAAPALAPEETARLIPLAEAGLALTAGQTRFSLRGFTRARDRALALLESRGPTETTAPPAAAPPAEDETPAEAPATGVAAAAGWSEALPVLMPALIACARAAPVPADKVVAAEDQGPAGHWVLLAAADERRFICIQDPAGGGVQTIRPALPADAPDQPGPVWLPPWTILPHARCGSPPPLGEEMGFLSLTPC